MSEGRGWDPRCAVREAMIAWLQAEHPEALARDGSEWVGTDPPPVRADGTRIAA